MILFDKPGIVLGKNPYYFGVSHWDIRLVLSSHSLSEDMNACIVIGKYYLSILGVAQRNINKRPQIIGSTINYGLQRESIKIRVTLDLIKNQLIIATGAN